MKKEDINKRERDEVPVKKQNTVLTPMEADKKLYFENDEINISVKLDSILENFENSLELNGDKSIFL